MAGPHRLVATDSIVAENKGRWGEDEKTPPPVATDGIVAPESKKTLRKALVGLYAKSLLARKE